MLTKYNFLEDTKQHVRITPGIVTDGPVLFLTDLSGATVCILNEQDINAMWQMISDWANELESKEEHEGH